MSAQLRPDEQKWTWPEVIATILLLPPMLLAAMWLIGSAIDVEAQHIEAHNQCLKAATNGLEIKQCR